MAELESLLQQEIPNGRKALLDSKANLENVANYCQQVYIDSGNKKQALDETKNFTTQSLASVAYQINTLASNMLHMLDIQAAELANMESSINNISMTVDIHKEKVARREIGLLTTNKVIQRNHQIVAPANPDRVVKYVRKPIDYTEMDDIGHGVKLTNQQSQGNLQVRRSSKTSSPSVDGRKRDSLKSVTSSTGYGTIRAVRTPTVPTDYNTTKRLPSMYSHSRARTNSNSSSGSGSMSSSGGYYPGAGPATQQAPQPVTMPPPPVQGPPPPPSVPGAMPPPPVMSSSMPPPPPIEGAPPPPPPPVVAPPAPPMSPAYSTPTVPRVPQVPNMMPNSVGGYASAAVYDPLPPPPPPSFGTEPSGMPPPPPADAVDMPLPPPDDGMMMPPPPMDDLPSPYANHDDSSSTAGSNYGSSDPSWAPKEYIQKAIAIYDYSAANADELSLREDEIVYVVRKNDDGWYEGVLNGITGLFPGNYVEAISA